MGFYFWEHEGGESHFSNRHIPSGPRTFTEMVFYLKSLWHIIFLFKCPRFYEIRAPKPKWHLKRFMHSSSWTDARRKATNSWSDYSTSLNKTTLGFCCPPPHPPVSIDVLWLLFGMGFNIFYGGSDLHFLHYWLYWLWFGLFGSGFI